MRQIRCQTYGKLPINDYDFATRGFFTGVGGSEDRAGGLPRHDGRGAGAAYQARAGGDATETQPGRGGEGTRGSDAGLPPPTHPTSGGGQRTARPDETGMSWMGGQGGVLSKYVLSIPMWNALTQEAVTASTEIFLRATLPAV